MGRKHRPRIWTAQKITASQAPRHDTDSTVVQRARQKEMDLQGIEPWTTPMLREYYTTKPQALIALLFALMKDKQQFYYILRILK
jgi:hypothetical protein